MKRAASSLVVNFLILLYACGPVHADYFVPEIKQVPVERLIKNIEQRLTALDKAAKPSEHLLLKVQIARIHALAYAQGKQELPTVGKTGELFEGPGSVSAIPRPNRGKPSSRGPQSYLARALVLYEEVLGARPGEPRLQLGYAWCLEESGDSVRAIEIYRAVVAAFWKHDEQINSLEHGERTVTQEAALRLIALLDPDNDAAEIAELKRRNAHFDKIRRWVTPIIIPLEDGLALTELIDHAAAVPFDLDGSGVPRAWRWITPHAAWLVWDPTDARRITSGLQFFGSVTFWLFWGNGYEALAALDDNGDRRLAGAELKGLALWRDGNADGLSDPGEVRPLADWGIRALYFEHEWHRAGFPYSPSGVLLENGRLRPSYDWILPAAPTPPPNALVN